MVPASCHHIACSLPDPWGTHRTSQSLKESPQARLTFQQGRPWTHSCVACWCPLSLLPFCCLPTPQRSCASWTAWEGGTSRKKALNPCSKQPNSPKDRDPAHHKQSTSPQSSLVCTSRTMSAESPQESPCSMVETPSSSSLSHQNMHRVAAIAEQMLPPWLCARSRNMWVEEGSCQDL